MHLSSPAFVEGGAIPKRYGKDFANVNPPLEWGEVPAGTKTFALVMEDPDIPVELGIPVFDHWVVYNIPGDLTEIPEAWNVSGVRGRGTRGDTAYTGPRPPDKEHRYFFYLYALDGDLDLPAGASKDELMKAMEGHVIDKATLMGTFAPHGEGVPE